MFFCDGTQTEHKCLSAMDRLHLFMIQWCHHFHCNIWCWADSYISLAALKIAPPPPPPPISVCVGNVDTRHILNSIVKTSAEISNKKRNYGHNTSHTKYFEHDLFHVWVRSTIMQSFDINFMVCGKNCKLKLSTCQAVQRAGWTS